MFRFSGGVFRVITRNPKRWTRNSSLFRRRDRLPGGVGEAVGRDDFQAAVLQQLPPFFDVGAFEAHHHRNFDAYLLHRLDDALAEEAAPPEAPEVVTRNG